MLDGRRFTSQQVLCAAGISQDRLTNILSKSELELCSETAGQGRARRYGLIDVYQIALLSEFTALTGSVQWSARALNYLLLVEHETHQLAREFTGRVTESESDYKARLCYSISNAPEPYQSRDLSNPHLLVADILALRHGTPKLDYYKADRKGIDLVRDASFSGGIVWKITTHLWNVDRKLAETLERGRE